MRGFEVSPRDILPGPIPHFYPKQLLRGCCFWHGPLFTNPILLMAHGFIIL